MTNQTEKTQAQLDPVAMAAAMVQLAERAQKIMADFAVRHESDFNFQRQLLGQALAAYGELWSHWLADPMRLVAAGAAWWQDYMALAGHAQKKWLHGNEPNHETPPFKPLHDKRFSAEAWQQNALLDLVKQTYLLTSDWLQKVVNDTPGLDEKARQKIQFYTRQYLDAVAPTNFWLTNPEALKHMAESGGASLLRGLENLLEDLEQSQGQLRVSMTDPSAYKLGQNIATTQGSVVFKNELMELIQYSPTTEQVHQTPLLIIPPWINKYYVLDLRPQNSFVQHALANGHTVFMISWVNPTEQHRHVTFEDYLQQGALAALDAIDAICNTRETNVIGYCLGGTLLACLLAFLAYHGLQQRVKSATYLVTLVDFAQPGDLAVFIDEAQITALEQHMFHRGYLEAAALATTFNMLRANDLIWSFVVHNYLLGREPLPFDLLYWNADSTNLPAAMHSYYLRQMYLHNRLVQPEALQMLGTPLNLQRITTPTYILATKEDHIAPWRSCYAATQLYSGPVDFVLAGSGHIAGVINPAQSGKYAYFTNPNLPADANAWLAAATQHHGSWWPHWASWVAKYGQGNVPARALGSAAYPALAAAPGDYVKVRA